MPSPNPAPHRVRVGEFHVDLASGELTSNGTRVRLQVQSLELLKALLDRPGMMVTREELRERLWPNDTFVDFDHGLNAAVRRLREALGDSADSPRFVETIPRKGYRLVAATDIAPLASAMAAPTVAETVPETSVASDGQPKRAVGRWVYLTIAVGIVSFLLAVVAWRARRSTPPPRSPAFASLSVDVPSGWSVGLLDQVALSPDNRHLAFTAVGPDRVGSLWVRPLTGAARRIPGSEGAVAPFWSPDGSRVGFFANGNLKSIALGDGHVQVLSPSAPAPIVGGSAAWLANGSILFMPLGTSLGTPVHAAGLRRLDSAGGEVLPIAPSPPERRDYIDYLAPYGIPGSKAFTFVRWNPSTVEMTGHVGEVGTSAIADLGRTGSRIAITTTGHAVFVRNGTLIAQQFDMLRRRLVGAPVSLAPDVSVSQPMFGHFAASADVIAYLPRHSMTSGVSMTLVDRRGTPLRRIGEVADYSSARISPDGTRLAVAERDPISGTRDIWVHDLSGQVLPVQLTSNSRDDMAPFWSADGRTILFTSDRSGERDIYRKEIATGQPEVLAFSSTDSKSLNAWSGDGQFFIYDTGARAAIDAHGRMNKDLFTVSMNASPRVRPLATTAAAESNADISPDGTLVAYQSTSAGGSDLMVETFPEKSRQFPVPGGGSEPIWRANGRELFFLSSRGELCAIEVTRSGETVRFGQPRVLFKPQNLPNVTRRYAPLPDGQRFVVLASVSSGSSQEITVLVNWRSAFHE